MKLPCGMTKTPFGGKFLFGDFIGFALWSIKRNEIIEQFKTETGIDLVAIVPKTSLDRMIDEATGNDHKEQFGAYLDWLAEKIWGLEETDNG